MHHGLLIRSLLPTAGLTLLLQESRPRPLPTSGGGGAGGLAARAAGASTPSTQGDLSVRCGKRQLTGEVPRAQNHRTRRNDAGAPQQASAPLAALSDFRSAASLLGHGGRVQSRRPGGGTSGRTQPVRAVPEVGLEWRTAGPGGAELLANVVSCGLGRPAGRGLVSARDEGRVLSTAGTWTVACRRSGSDRSCGGSSSRSRSAEAGAGARDAVPGGPRRAARRRRGGLGRRVAPSLPTVSAVGALPSRPAPSSRAQRGLHLQNLLGS